MPTAAAYALILTSNQRGAGMGGTLLILLAMLIGGVSLLAAFMTIIGRADAENAHQALICS